MSKKWGGGLLHDCPPRLEICGGGTSPCRLWWIGGTVRVDVCARVVPPKVLLDSASQAVSLSERVLLDCPVSDADPAPVILWTKDNQPLQLGGRLEQLPNGSLAIYDSAVSYNSCYVF